MLISFFARQGQSMGTDESTDGSQYKRVHCDKHGDNTEAYVCGHLLHGIRQGFVTSPGEELTNPHPDAWCYECEEIRQQHGGEWNAESESRIIVQLVCGDCYEEIKQRNVVINPDNHLVQ